MRHLSHILRQTAARYPRREAIIFETQRISWSELDRSVDGIAAAFLDLGVQRGDTIGIMCSTRPEYILVYLAALRVGATLVGFNVHYTEREILEYAAIVGPAIKAVVGGPRSVDALQALTAAMPSIRHAIATHAPAPPGWLLLDQLTQSDQPDSAAAVRAREAELSEEDGAIVVFTGGVTGTPKGALLTHRNIVANIAAQNRHLGWHAHDRIMLHLPMNHVSGATLLAAGAVLSGAALVMLDRFHPERTLALVERERVTVFGQVPAMWIMELGLPDFERYDLSSVRLTLCSGAPTPPHILTRIAGIAPISIHAWGLTETAGMVTYTRLDDGPDVLLRSAGRVPPEFEVRIRGEGGKWLGPGEEGEIVVRGDCVMAGYVNNPAGTAHVIDAEGWLRTGDLGRLDENCYLTWTGLTKRMYTSGGYNVFPAEIETYLERHPDIERCHCVGVPHPVMGETGRISVLPRPGSALTVADIRQLCKRGLARYKNPRYVEIAAA